MTDSQEILYRDFLKSLASVKKDYSGQGITKLSELSLTPDVTHLYLSDNPLESLDGLSNLPKLEVFKVDRCGLHNLSGVGVLPKVHTLSATDNNLSSIRNINNLPHLQKLYLSGNKIEDYGPLALLDELMILSLNNSGLASIPKINLKTLIWLWFNNNSIQDLANISEIPNLQELYLNNNKLAGLDGIEKCIHLAKLEVDNNQLKDISALKELDDLIYLSLRNNGLMSVPADIPPSVEILRLDENRIREIDGIDHLLNMRHFHISSNPLHDSGFSNLNGYINKNRWVRRITFSVNSCGINWASKQAQKDKESIEKTGMRISTWPEDVSFNIPCYRNVDLIGEGGTFNVFLLQKEHDPITNLKEYIIQISTDKAAFRGGIIHYFHSRGIDPMKNFWDSAVDGLVEKMPSSMAEVDTFCKILVGLSVGMIKEGAEKYMDPGGEYYVILMPKEGHHSQKYVNLSGYRMMKEFGQDQLQERGLHAHLMLQGIKGVPTIHKVVDVSFRKRSGEHITKKCLIEQYVHGNTLDSFLQEHIIRSSREGSRDSMKVIMKYLANALGIVSDVHEKGILHHDIAPNNLLVDKNTVMYLIDYALSCFGDLRTTGYASRRYSSPELLKNSENIGPPSDLWPFGIMLYSFIKAKHPISEDYNEVASVVLDEKEFEKRKSRIDFRGIPIEISQLVINCLEYDAGKRYNNAKKLKQDFERVMARL